MSRRPCDTCRELVDVYARVEKRIEYRRCSDQGREFVVKLGELCMRCASEEVHELRGTPHVAQGALL